MDFETFVYFAIFAVFILYRVLTGKKKSQPNRPRQGPRPTQQRTPQTSADLDEALQEIRRALGWETPQQQRPAPPVPAPHGQSAAERSEGRFPGTSDSALEDRTRAREAARRHTEAGGSASDAARRRVEARRGPETFRREPESVLREPPRPRPSHPTPSRPSPAPQKHRMPFEDALPWEGAVRPTVRPHGAGLRIDVLETRQSTEDHTRAQRTDLIRARLQNPEHAREAFLISEILASRRRRRF